MTPHIIRLAEAVTITPRTDIEVVRLVEAVKALAPDLPEPNDPTASFVPDGKGWLLTDQDGPVVWTVPGGLVMVQRLEPGELTPEQAKELAAIFLAAANYTEKDMSE